MVRAQKDKRGSEQRNRVNGVITWMKMDPGHVRYIRIEGHVTGRGQVGSVT